MKKRIVLTILALAAISFAYLAIPVSADDDDDKDITIRIKTAVKNGDAPLPVSFVAEIEAAEELDQYIYESSIEWRIEGSFVLTSRYSTGSDPVDPSMRKRPVSQSEMMMRNSKHLIARDRKRASRKKFGPESEVKRTHEWEYTFERAGTFYITFSLRNGKYTSNQIKIEVRGDTTYDPFRDPY